ncbi:hypothetical protein DTO021C3_882 [Paecilomyces variotii]|nr:hypothetical protein DTO169C6_2451 [Paecilomyces variotii]KAJ9249947.1 hypothetical protein DTO195F2_8317 [Paecilomyces variotii]KAJ9291525.1 hypothetical protein DTO021C3_882 [Paecilomyces variotii]KAJ9402819.1 hypothetical protein DTO282F9_229 [Paecilomyces variotii]
MPRRHAVITLHPIYSPDTLPFRSLTFASDKDNVSIGRSSKCLSKNLVPAHNNAWFESRVMSRDHARIGVRLDKEIVYVRDNGSMHGTALNDKKIPTGKDVTVQSGDILTFGNEVTRGSETFAPLKVRCECQWFDNDDKEPSEPPEELPTKPSTNSFSVPDDDEVIEIVRDSGHKQVTTFTVPDSDDESEADSTHPKDQSTPATSPLSKDAADGCTRDDAETSSPKASQSKPAANGSDLAEGTQKVPVTVDEDQALVTPTTTPPAAFTPGAFSDNHDWENLETYSSEEDSESQMSEELEDDEDAGASCSSDESFEQGFANSHVHTTNKSYTPPPAVYATLSTGPCIDEWAGPSAADHAPQWRPCRFPSGVFVKAPSSYGYSDGPFMLDHTRPSTENVGSMEPIILPGPSTLVDHRTDPVVEEQRMKPLPRYNSFGKTALPSFTHSPLFPQCTGQNGSVANSDKAALALEHATERRTGESTATTRVSIADIVHDCKPVEPRTSLKRKAAEMELESIVSGPSYFDEFSDLRHCGESIRDAQLESVFGDVASLPDAQPQLPINDLDSSPPELIKIPAVSEEQSAGNGVSDNGHCQKRAKLTRAPSRRRKLARDAVVALGGVFVGSILTVAGLASLPPDFFTG